MPVCTYTQLHRPLFYQLGVRESLGRSECILMFEANHAERALQLQRFSPQYSVIVYRVLDGVCLCVPQDELQRRADDAGDGMLSLPTAPSDIEQPTGVQAEALAARLAVLLRSMEVQSVTQRKQWFMQELRKARTLDENLREPAIKRLERHLTQDPSCVSANIVLGMALAYRDIQDYDSTIALVASLQNHPDVGMEVPSLAHNHSLFLSAAKIPAHPKQDNCLPPLLGTTDY